MISAKFFARTWNSHEAKSIFHRSREKKCCDDFVSRDCNYRTGIFRRCSRTSSSAGRRCARNRLRESERTSARGGKEWLARGIPGLTLAVAVDGKIVYAEGFGYADLEQRVPVWPTTKFRIASDSK